jgi:hypothetical protein
VSHGYHKDDKAAVLYRGDNTVIPNAVAPQPLAIAGKGMTQAARVGTARNSLSQIAQHTRLRVGTELAQVANGDAIKSDPPRPARPSALRAPLELSPQVFKRHAWTATRKAPARQIVIFNILDLRKIASRA